MQKEKSLPYLYSNANHLYLAAKTKILNIPPIKGGAQVNVNVYLARRHWSDNILASKSSLAARGRLQSEFYLSAQFNDPVRRDTEQLGGSQ